MQLSKHKLLMVGSAALVICVLIILLTPSKRQFKAEFVRYESNSVVVKVSNRGSSGKIVIATLEDVIKRGEPAPNLPPTLLLPNTSIETRFTPKPGDPMPFGLRLHYLAEPDPFWFRTKQLLRSFTKSVHVDSVATFTGLSKLELPLPPQPSTNKPNPKE